MTFTHEWEDSVTGEIGINVLILANLINSSSLKVSDDGTGFDSGSIFVDIGANRLCMVANTAVSTLRDVNDNYAVDEPAQNGIAPMDGMEVLSVLGSMHIP